jgi:hypothetical protein
MCGVQIRPRGWHERTSSIGQYQRQMQLAASMAPAEYIER